MKAYYFLISLFVLNVTNALYAEPKRIISTSLASDEILLDVLKESNRSRIVALSKLVDDPHYSSSVHLARSVQGRVDTNVEQILALKPDLVILASYNRPDFKKLMTKVNVPTLTLENFSHFDAIRHNIRLISKAIKEETAGEKLIDKFSQQLTKLKSKPKSISGCILNFSKEGWVLGIGTTFSSIIEHLGYKNCGSIAKISGWRKLGFESMAKWKVHALVVTDENQDWQRQPWGLFDAVKQKRILTVKNASLHSVSHHVINAMQQLTDGLKKFESP